MASAPTTHGSPRPRATTLAWDVAPPRVVRIPFAHSIPWTSSGEVSVRVKMPGSFLRPLVEARHEKLIDLSRVDPEARLLPRDTSLRRHVHSDLHRRARRPLARACLKNPEPPD